jgi:triosephosphate isomerase (TIM)
MSTKYIVGNWKSNQTQTESHIWFNGFVSLNPQIDSLVNVIICTPFTDISDANRIISEKHVSLHIGAQDVSPFPTGSHTGQISASMLAELVSFCIVGHSERRREAGETSKEVATKVKNLLEYNITPIICVDTPYLDQQLKNLLAERIDLKRCIFAYEPVSAIGSGKAQDPLESERVCSKISFLTESVCPILYGGSVVSENIVEYLNQDHISGVLVGGQSLSPQNFYNLINKIQS